MIKCLSLHYKETRKQKDKETSKKPLTNFSNFQNLLTSSTFFLIKKYAEQD